MLRETDKVALKLRDEALELCKFRFNHCSGACIERGLSGLELVAEEIAHSEDLAAGSPYQLGLLHRLAADGLADLLEAPLVVAGHDLQRMKGGARLLQIRNPVPRR